MSRWDINALKKNRRIKVLLGLFVSTVGVFMLAYLVDRVLG